VWDYDPPTPLDAGNLLSHLLFGSINEGLRPWAVIVGGEVRLREGQVLGLDETAALGCARGAAERLWARV